MTICHVDKFLHMTEFFSTGTARGARDKYEVCCDEHSKIDLVDVSEIFLHNWSIFEGDEWKNIKT